MDAEWLDRLDGAIGAIAGSSGFETDEVVELPWRRRVTCRRGSVSCTFDVVYNSHARVTSIAPVGILGSLAAGLWQEMVVTLTTEQLNGNLAVGPLEIVGDDDFPDETPQTLLLYRALVVELQRRDIGIRSVRHNRGDYHERYRLWRSGKEGDALYYYDGRGRFNGRVQIVKCTDAQLRLDIQVASATAFEQLLSDEF